MRVLTVRQPWAWAIIHGGKDVENRSRNIAGSYRGPVAIHAGLGFEKGTQASEAHRAAHGTETPTELTFGAVIGVVDLVDVHSATVLGGCGWMDNHCRDHGTCRHHCSPWAMGPAPKGGWYQHLVFAEPQPLKPIPAKGRLGLWKPDDDLEQQIARAQREADVSEEAG